MEKFGVNLATTVDNNNHVFKGCSDKFEIFDFFGKEVVIAYLNSYSRLIGTINTYVEILRSLASVRTFTGVSCDNKNSGVGSFGSFRHLCFSELILRITEGVHSTHGFSKLFVKAGTEILHVIGICYGIACLFKCVINVDIPTGILI